MSYNMAAQKENYMKSRFAYTLFSILVIFSMVSIPLSQISSEEKTTPVRVILIGWDGAQREHVQECLGRGELPTLKTLMSQGAMVNIDVVGKTDTKAGWSEILTGYGPDITKVYSNANFAPIPEGYTVFERLKQYYGKDFITGAVIGKDHHVGGNAAEVKRLLTPRELEFLSTHKAFRDRHDIGDVERVQAGGTEGRRETDDIISRRLSEGKVIDVEGKKYLYSPAEPYFHTWKNVDVWQKGLGTNDVVGEAALKMIDQYRDRSFFYFIHFAEVDHSGHKYGENSKEYNDALISSDAWTGRIIARLKELGIYENTLVIVTADHGFNEGEKSHSNAPTVFFVSNCRQTLHPGTRADVAPTIYKHLGIPLDTLKPELTGKPLY